MKYNGNYQSYQDVMDQTKKRKNNAKLPGSHVKWEVFGKLVSKDVDYRARQILREIDRATFTRNEFISSDVLHANDQKFPTRVLRMQLEEALDRLLVEQIEDRERAAKINVDSTDSEEYDEQDMDHEETESEDEGEGEQKEVSFNKEGGDEQRDQEKEIADNVARRARKRARRKLKLKKATLDEEVIG